MATHNHISLLLPFIRLKSSLNKEQRLLLPMVSLPPPLGETTIQAMQGEHSGLCNGNREEKHPQFLEVYLN